MEATASFAPVLQDSAWLATDPYPPVGNDNWDKDWFGATSLVERQLSGLPRSTSQMSVSPSSDEIPPLEVPFFDTLASPLQRVDSMGASLKRADSVGAVGTLPRTFSYSETTLTREPSLGVNPMFTNTMDSRSEISSLDTEDSVVSAPSAPRTLTPPTEQLRTPAPPTTTPGHLRNPDERPVRAAAKAAAPTTTMTLRTPTVKSEPPRKRARGSGQVSAETLAERRARHNQVEIRRRQKIADRFSTLRTLTKCDDTDKGSILQAAIEKVEALTAQLARLSTKNAAAEKSTKCTAIVKQQQQTQAVVTTANAANQGNNAGAPALAIISVDGVLVDWNVAFGNLIGRPPARGPSPLAARQPGDRYKAIQARNSADFRTMLPDTGSSSKFYVGVDDLLTGRMSSVADAVTRMKRLDNGVLFAVRSLMWVVMEMGAALYIKLLVVPLDNNELERDRSGRVQICNDVPSTCGVNSAAASPASFFAGATRMVKQEA